MAIKVELRNKQWVKRVLHKPSIKVVRAAARFVKYTGHKLRVSYSSRNSRWTGTCQGKFAFRIKSPDPTCDPLDHAIRFFDTACQELCHCQDHIDDLMMEYWYDDIDKKRPEWRRRTEERAVFDKLYDLTDGTAKHYEHQFWVTQVKLPKYVQNAILELAVLIEESATG